MKSFFRQLLSSDERRISSLILFAFVFTGMAVWVLTTGLDVPPRLADLLIWLYGFIAGGSAADIVSKNISKRKNNDVVEEENIEE